MQATEQYIDPVEPSYPEKLIAILASPDLPRVVGVHWVARQLERPWAEIRSNIRASTKVAKGLRDLGWKYRSQAGCKARSVFERCAAAGRQWLNQSHGANSLRDLHAQTD